MKIYVLTHCGREGNYTPSVYMTQEAAREELKRRFLESTIDKEYDPEYDPQYDPGYDPEYDDEPELEYEGQLVDCSVYDYKIYEDQYQIIYIDGTYDCVEIFEVEIIENKEEGGESDE